MSLILGIKNTDVTKALQDLADSLPKEAGYSRVGVLEDATYPDGTAVALVAGVQEFGSKPKKGSGQEEKSAAHEAMETEFGSATGNIPPRSFIRSTMAQRARDWSDGLQTLLKNGNVDSDTALKILGEQASGDVHQQAVTITSPPLKPATVARKGWEKPLVDSEHMVDSISYDIKKGVAGEE